VPAPTVTHWPSTNAPSEATVTATLREAGLRPSSWSSGPGDGYGANSHPYHKVLHCLRGSIRFDLPTSGERPELNAGDRLDIPPGTTHSAIVGRDGVTCVEARRLQTMGMRAAHTAELSFQDCRVPAANLLGEENSGFASAMRTLTDGRVMAAGFALGLGKAAFDRSLKFAQERSTFGQAIGKFQGLQWLFAGMATRLEAARLLTHQAAWRADQGLPNITQSSMAKLFASETAREIAKTVVLIHGGAGFMMEHDIQRFYPDCMVLEIGEGTSHIQRNTIAHQLGL